MDIVVEEFKKELKMQLGDKVKKLVLFGSRARGDYKETSDYDFLVVVEDRKKYKDTIRDIEVEILNKYDYLLGSIICTPEEWQIKTNYPIGINIQKEGVILI